MKSIFPTYIRLAQTTMRHTGDGVYWRDAGNWEAKTDFIKGKHIVVDEGLASLNNREVFPITHEEWVEDQKGYL